MANNAQYVTLGVAEDLFATPVERVREILDLCPITRLPHAPANLLGMIDVRNQAVPVVDLRATLGLPAVPDTENTRILVLAIQSAERELIIGLKADRVYEVTVLDREELDAPPDIGAAWDTRAIAGVGRRNGAFVTVIDLDRLFANLQTQLPASAA